MSPAAKRSLTLFTAAELKGMNSTTALRTVSDTRSTSSRNLRATLSKLTSGQGWNQSMTVLLMVARKRCRSTEGKADTKHRLGASCHWGMAWYGWHTCQSSLSTNTCPALHQLVHQAASAKRREVHFPPQARAGQCMFGGLTWLRTRNASPTGLAVNATCRLALTLLMKVAQQLSAVSSRPRDLVSPRMALMISSRSSCRAGKRQAHGLGSALTSKYDTLVGTNFKGSAQPTGHQHPLFVLVLLTLQLCALPVQTGQGSRHWPADH